jgi:hypothetical protein
MKHTMARYDGKSYKRCGDASRSNEANNGKFYPAASNTRHFLITAPLRLVCCQFVREAMAGHPFDLQWLIYNPPSWVQKQAAKRLANQGSSSESCL